MPRTLRIALVGAGMFGGDVHLRTYAAVQRSGIAPHLARIGLDSFARELASIEFQLAAIATRSEESARRACSQFAAATGCEPKAYAGETPWVNLLRDSGSLDVLAVATPDHLHTEPILAGLRAGAHVITEKPMCLEMFEADEIVRHAREQGRLVAVDMHKRYDPDHLRIARELKSRLGEPLYGIAYLEEPLEVSTSTFKWVEHSDPFSYVGTHWVDLIYSYYGSKPVSLTAVGQKKRLLRQGIDAYDAVQVRVDFQNGMSVQFNNNWITPPDFEGPVNQGHELVGTEGKIESDQQYRGLRWWCQGRGSRTGNTHFSRAVLRPDGSEVSVGYGVDSLIASLTAVCRMKFLGTEASSLAGTYPTAEEARIVVAVIHAARVVRDLNFKYLQQGKGAPVTARFGEDGIVLIDPYAPQGQVFRVLYDKAL